MWKQPFESKKELRESYLKMPPEALLIRKMGPNIAVDAEEDKTQLDAVDLYRHWDDSALLFGVQKHLRSRC
jgi:hypothetical protein